MTSKPAVLSTAQWDVLEHLKQFGPSPWGVFRGNVVAALVRKNLAAIGTDGMLRLVPVKDPK